MTERNGKKLMTADEAVRLISDGANVRISGAALVCSSAKIFKNIGRSFLQTGHPKGITIISEGSPGYNTPEHDYFAHLAHPGLVRRIIGGHMGFHHALFPMIRSNEILGYNVSQGVLSILASEQVAGKKGYYTKVGLGTQQDPRQEGCKLNKGIDMEDIVELRHVGGEEYLYFKAVHTDVCVLRGSYADAKGNVTFVAEPSDNDALSAAMATHNEGGKVIVFVKEQKNEHFNPRLVNIPHFLVDAVVVDPDHIQAAPDLPYSPYYSNEEWCDEDALRDIMNNGLKSSVRKREVAHKIIARRAALELNPGAIVNIGFGIPQMINSEALSIGVELDSLVMTTETGVTGGVQHPSVFSVSMNADAVYDQASQFRFYEGGGLDIGFLGALEADEKGNVNVCSKGPVLAGVGGFNFIVHSSKKIVYCFTFMRGSGYSAEEGKLTPYNGKSNKLVQQVECITMNADIEVANGKNILYVTERCVFACREGGLEIIEIAPGLDLQKDVLDLLEFTPKIADTLVLMPEICFKGLDYA